MIRALVELIRDARRYRFLRELWTVSWCVTRRLNGGYVVKSYYCNASGARDMDAAIDEEMSEKAEDKHG